MANWSLPTTASTYANYTAELDGRLNDLAYGLDPAVTTLTNPKTNSIRWNSASTKWEKYNGTAWADLAATYSINAATANAWATGRTIALTGDVTGTSAAWTGSGNISFAATLATVNSNTGSFGSASAVPVITVNGKGLITAVSTAALGSIATQASSNVTITGGAISGTALTLVQSTTAAPTAEGRMEWDTDGDELKIGTGSATKTVVNTDNSQTITNKTFGSGNTWNGNAVPVAYGGTGAADAATARTNLGVGSLGTQAANSVAITGGAISGTAITLVQSTTAAPTAEGCLEWDTDDDLLILGTASGSKIQVNTDSAQTLTNKTLTSPTINGGTLAAPTFTLRNLAAPTTDGDLTWDSATKFMKVGTGSATRTVVDAESAQTISGVKTFSSTIQGSISGDAATVDGKSFGTFAAAGGVLYATSTTAANSTVAGTSGQFLKSSGASAPVWATLEMTDIPDAAFKKSVRVATTAALTVSFASNTLTNTGTLAALVIDGVTMAVNDRVLVKDQATAAQNGIYTVTNIGSASVAWTMVRATDADAISEIGSSIVAVDRGTVNGGKVFTTTLPVSGTLNTSNMPWYEVMYNNGTWGISITGNAATVTNGVYTTGNQNIAGVKTFTDAIAANGNIWITNTAPIIHLVESDQTLPAGRRRIVQEGNVFTLRRNTAASGDFSTEVNDFSVDASSNLTAAGNVSGYSDERLKEDWNESVVSFALIEKLAKVKAGTYRRKDIGTYQIGVSAQSLQTAMNEAVNEDANGMLSVAYGNAALTACVALAREVVALRRRVEMLEPEAR